MPNVEYSNLEIQEILDALTKPSSPHNETRSVGERAANVAPFVPHNTTITSMSDSGTSLVPPFRPCARCYYFSHHLNFNTSACGRLIRRAFTLHELPSLIEAIFSSKNEADEIRSLSGDGAQTFIDVMDEVRSTLAMNPPTEIDINVFY